MLASVAEPSDVVVDPETNRVFIRGGERIHQLAWQIIETLDRPADADWQPGPNGTAQAQGVEQPVLKPYPMLPSHEPQIIALERKYAGRSDVRFARDSRTSQLLVLAPASIQAEVAQVLAGAPNPGGQPQFSPSTGAPSEPGRYAENSEAYRQPASQRPVPPGGGSEDRYREQPHAVLAHLPLQLKNLSVDALHARLEKLMGRPLPLLEDANRTHVQFGIEAAPGVRVSVSADRATRRLTVVGHQDIAESWAKVISAMDVPDSTGRNGRIVTQLVAARNARKDQLRLVAQTLSAQPGSAAANQQAVFDGARGGQGQLVTMLFQPGADAQPPGQAQPNAGQQPLDAGQQPPDEQMPDIPGVVPDITEGPIGLIGPVQIEYIEGLDILVVRGNERDVARVMQLIEQIERETLAHPPRIEIVPLRHVQSAALAALLQQIYTDVLIQRQGIVNITPLVTPNALLLIGREENVAFVMRLIEQLDQPADPAAETEIQVFVLRHAPAETIKTAVDEAFTLPDAPTGLAPRVQTVADFRSNTLVVRAAPRDMANVRDLINRLDTDEVAPRMIVRHFPLRHALAADLATVLVNALSGQPIPGQQQAQPRSAAVELLTVDAEGRQVVESSGVLTEVRITPHEQTNTLVVTAPPSSMNLIASLIARLDQPSGLVGEIKVFTIERGDATGLAEMLRELFGQPTTGGGGQFQQPGFGTAVTGAESSLVPLRFSVDQRSNSIIASGTRDDLLVVQAILLTLDAEEMRGRAVRVFKLKNLFAPNVADALNALIIAERQVEQIIPGAISFTELIEREAVIVPEVASNSLIISATPQLFEKIVAIVEEMDARPPMVMVQVLIAEVSLNDTDEFGVEIGLQDSILFDRGLLEILNTTQVVTTTTTPGGAVTTVQEDVIQSANITPGFAFLNPLASLGNSANQRALDSAGKVGTQGLSNFGVGRINTELGFGGFVFSAGSENLNILLRALQESRRLEVLSRPQIMALDNQFAVVQVGQIVPTIQSVSPGVAVGGQTTFSTIDREVGLILRVQPRVSPDGMVVMQIEAEKSAVGPEEEGIPISISPTGDVIRTPRINRTFAGTIVQAMSGQTIVLGGLISKSTTDVHRRVPLLADIPLLGDLFRYDGTAVSRSELLIIMTPRVVRSYLDAEMLKQVESSRMNWVLSDVIALHGPSGLRGRTDKWTDAECEVVYPTYVPTEGEIVLPAASGEPTPAGPQAFPEPPMQGAAQGRLYDPPFEAAPAIYRNDPQDSRPVRQTAYEGLVPLPPTK